MFPTVEPVVSVEESCIYTLSPDWNPILDTLPAARNIVIGVGFSGINGLFSYFLSVQFPNSHIIFRAVEKKN